MLRRDRRRERKRTAQAVSNKRQSALLATWGGMGVGLFCLLARALGLSPSITLGLFVISLVTASVGLVCAHFMWRKEKIILGHDLPAVSVKLTAPLKILHHRAEDTHRMIEPKRGATRLSLD